MEASIKHHNHLVILTASSGLGSFVPAVTLSHYLQSIGYHIELCCIEQLYHDKAIAQFKKMKSRCEEDFRAAKLAQQLIENAKADVFSAVKPCQWQNLSQRWLREKPKKFIIFSGFWLPLLADLAEKNQHSFLFDAIHMDASVASSWQSNVNLPRCQYIWLFHLEQQYATTLTPTLKVNDWQQREARVVCHGGGWNIGNVNDPLSELSLYQIATLSFIAMRPSQSQGDLQHYIQIQEDWLPWIEGCQDGGTFPPHTRYSGDKVTESLGSTNFFQQQVSSCQGIVTKPGGGSLLDSITTATPLILLPAYGAYEQANGELWLNKGFAITYEQWRQHQFDWQMLQALHENLIAHHQMLAKEKSHYAP